MQLNDQNYKQCPMANIQITLIMMCIVLKYLSINLYKVCVLLMLIPKSRYVNERSLILIGNT